MAPTNSGDLEHVPCLSVNSKIFENNMEGEAIHSDQAANENGAQ